ncbi:MAG: pectate lyase [Chitinispirillia bacterium]|nr:pectate lyase [Chitinispirillia bacterium]
MKKSFPKLVLAGLFLFTANAAAQNYNDWDALLRNNDNWFATNSQAVTVGNQIIQYQLADGGWRKDPATTSGEWAKSTIDNDATISQIIFLARLYSARNTASYLTSLQRGIDLLLSGQYANGGWPQIFGAGSNTYHAHITFNDGAMTQVMDLLFDVSRKSAPFTFIDDNRASRARAAVERGIDCILSAQIVFANGDTTAWCQQHDRSTLAPRGGRAYEVPSVTAGESIGIVNFLKKYHNSLGANPRRDIVLSVNAAIRWLDKVKIEGIRMNDITTNGTADRVIVTDPSSTLWARFYEINTARPIFVGRDGIVRYNMADIEQERRAGYRWYGTWPRNLIRDGLLPVPDDRPPVGTYIGAGNFFDSLLVFDNANASIWSIHQNFGAGSKVYGDRDFVVGAPIPAALTGLEWISPSIVSRTRTSPSTIVQFKMKRAGVVNILHEDRVTAKPAWIAAAGFTVSTPKIFVNDGSADRTFTTYSKSVSQGETVALGPNSNDGTTSTLMYIIAFSQSQPTSAINNNAPSSSNFLKISHTGNGGIINVNYTIRDKGAVRIDLYNIKGKKVRPLVNTVKSAGVHSERISTNGLSTGTYFVKMRAGSQTLQERVFIAK